MTEKKSPVVDVKMLAQILERNEAKRLIPALNRVNQPAGVALIGHVMNLVGHKVVEVGAIARQALAKFRHPTAAAVHMLNVRPKCGYLTDDKMILSTRHLRSIRFTEFEQDSVGYIDEKLKPYSLSGMSDAVRFAVVYTALSLQQKELSDD